ASGRSTVRPHGGGRVSASPSWYPPRPRGPGETARGPAFSLRLVDRPFEPAHPADSVLVVRTTCTNRDLPTKIPRHGDEVRFDAEFSAPGVTLRCPRNPTPPLRVPLRRSLQWRGVSHPNPHHPPPSARGRGAGAVPEQPRP